uniref:Uncharacterized protein n=1 Tax=Avena sativa TaxID=4498 RepID=A0ACD5XJ16_AVESA
MRPRTWVASTDGTAVWYFRAGRNPSLHDPLTGVVTLLPPFPKEKDCRRWEGSTSGIVYSDDGTVLLRSLSRHRNTTKFRAAVLLPGATAWKVVDRTLVVVGSHELDDIYSYYYRGKIRITAPRGLFPAPDLHYKFMQSYMLESHGELLCVSVYISLLHYTEDSGSGVAGLLRALSVTVHVMLEEEESPPGVMLWARKDCKSLADSVLFLGWPTSFAMDASRLHSDAASGGCAYFVYHDVDVMSNKACHVLIRYNLIDNKAKFVERLPEAWNNDMFMWLFPQPSIAPTKEKSSDATLVASGNPNSRIDSTNPPQIRRVGDLWGSACEDGLRQRRRAAQESRHARCAAARAGCWQLQAEAKRLLGRAGGDGGQKRGENSGRRQLKLGLASWLNLGNYREKTVRNEEFFG